MMHQRSLPRNLETAWEDDLYGIAKGIPLSEFVACERVLPQSPPCTTTNIVPHLLAAECCMLRFT
jgi:hypothetical protein